ncbi:molybdopterin-dependent oxidoreductase [candidate division KSB1 bacterium]
MPESDIKYVTLKINGEEARVPPGSTIMQAADSIGAFIPRYCYHPGLPKVGNCRICLVEVEGATELLASCVTPVINDMVVHTESEKVKKARASVMEFLLINHPLDCPFCDKAGECDLQDYAYMYWQPWSRFREKREVQGVKQVSEEIRLYTDRCILCGRCVRFLDEQADKLTLGFIKRGGHTELEPDPDTVQDSLLAGNIVDLCPVGALILEEFLFKSRVWELEPVKSVCPVCSMGCNIWIDVRENRVLRIRPRENPQINEHWICDLGRFFFRELSSVARLKQPLVGPKGKLAPAVWEEAIAFVRDGLNKVRDSSGPEAIAGLGSPYLTREDNRMLMRLLTEPIGSDRIYLRDFHKGDRVDFAGGFIISENRAPNITGAAEALAMEKWEGSHMGDMLTKIDAGLIKAAVIVAGYPGPQISKQDLEVLAKLEFLAVIDVTGGSWEEVADALLPGVTSFEKWGTFTAKNGEIQTIRPALAPPGEARPEWRILADLARAMGLDINITSALDIKIETGD